MDFFISIIILGAIIILISSLLNVENNDTFDADLKRLYYGNNETKTYINKYGYRCFKDSNILVHRWVMSKHLHRKLFVGEIIHHIDGNKINNKINNLQLFTTQQEHTQHHLNNLKNYGSWYEEVPEYVAYK